MKRKRRKRPSIWHNRELYCWLLAILLPILAVYPALTNPVEEHAVDAALFHVYRAVLFADAQADGWFYPRWVQPVHAGLGGPMFSFYPPLLYFLMAGLHSLGFAFPITWRIVVSLTLVTASTGMFALARLLFKRADVALACAVFYAYAPYLLRDLFERGSPQGLAIALYPWVLWGMLRLADRPSGRRFALSSLLWAATILFHNVAALLFLPVIGLFLLFVVARDGIGRSLWLVGALVAGLLLIAFYLLPFMGEREFVQLENAAGGGWASPAEDPLLLAELFSPTAVFDIGIANNTTGQALGLLPAGVLPLGPVLAWGLRRRKRTAEMFFVLGLTLWGVLMIWMQTRSATPLWHSLSTISLLTYLNFRWRLLASLGVVTVLLAGYGLTLWLRRWKKVVVALFIGITIGVRLPSLYPQLLLHHADVPSSPTVADVQMFERETAFYDLSYFNELVPRWRSTPFTQEEAQRVATVSIAALPEGGRVIAEEGSTGWLQVQLETPVPFEAALHMLYFPGWVGAVDGEPQPLRPMEDSGYILINVPAGTHTVTLQYEGTAIQHWGDRISVAAALVLLIVALLWRAKKGFSLGSDAIYLKPRWWVMLGMIGLVGLKAVWIDPHTTLLRRSSSCQSLPGVDMHTDVRFGPHLRLCGYELGRTSFRPGDLVDLTLYWELEQPAEEPASSFVHFLGTTFNPETGNPLWGQQDKLMMITQWTPHRLYRDPYQLEIPLHTPPGEYQIEIGWWAHATGQRFQPQLIQPAASLSVSDLDALLISGFEVR